MHLPSVAVLRNGSCLRRHFQRSVRILKVSLGAILEYSHRMFPDLLERREHLTLLNRTLRLHEAWQLLNPTTGSIRKTLENQLLVGL